MQRLIQKDERALAWLMERYGDVLLRTAYLLLKDRQEAEDAVQESFIQAFDKIGQLQDAHKLQSWLTRIVVNRCRMKQRSWGWRSLFPSSDVGQWEHVSEEEGPEELVLLEWRNVQLSKAIHSIKYIYREAITLYYFNEMSVQDIAEELGMSVNTVKARLARGRQLLKKMLEQEGEHHGS